VSKYFLNYENAWEKFYANIEDCASIPWDVQPENAIVNDFEAITEIFDSKMPIIDLGCGVGTQSYYLANKFDQVLGLDVSKKAIEIARLPFKNVDFRVFDLLDNINASCLHQELGDANIYMRGLLHQIAPQHRSTAVETIRILLGKTGVLYMIELTESANMFFAHMRRKNGEAVSAIDKTLSPGITFSYGVNVKKIIEIFPQSQFEVINSSKKFIKFKANTDSGFIDVPSSFIVLKANSNKNKL
jgi:SAM-dependent methyltransferase